MNKIIGAIFVFFVLFVAPANATQVDVVRASGVKAWVIKDNSLPIIAVKIAFKNAGYAHDEVGKQGIGNFVAGTLNEGAGEWDSQTFQKLLDENAIEMSFDADRDDFYITLKTVSGNLDLALNMLKSALVEPLFNSEDIERVRAQIATNIKKSDEEAGFLAAKKFNQVMFGNHPYSKLKDGDLVSLNNISADDLINFVANKFARDNMVVSIVGDVDESSAQKIFAKLTEKLPETSKTSKVVDFTAYPQTAPQKVNINNPQTKIVFASKGVKRSDDKFFALYLLSHILGGDGFQAHLVKEVREKRGLAYYIGTDVQNMDHADLLVGTVGTTAAGEQEVIGLIKTVYSGLQNKGVTKQELDDAKAFLTGSFALNLDKNEKLAAYLSMMQQENLGMDYLQKRNDYINSVTLEQVNSVAKELLAADSLVFISAGQ